MYQLKVMLVEGRKRIGKMPKCDSVTVCPRTPRNHNVGLSPARPESRAFVRLTSEKLFKTQYYRRIVDNVRSNNIIIISFAKKCLCINKKLTITYIKRFGLK